jgi:hypothetical protein
MTKETVMKAACVVSGIYLCFLICALPASGALVSSNDLWDVTQGCVVDASSGCLSSFPETRMFGGGSDTIFRDYMAAGTVHWVEWHTPTPVTIESFNLVASHDGGTRDIRYRGFSAFRLYTGDGAGN